jgi:hypothetical protein
MNLVDGYKDRTLILRALGGFLLLSGIIAALIGPVEIYSFYLFTEGGRFHYEGFRFGSFMFGNIACQVLVYYVTAGLLIPLGYGHLRLRRWARTLALTLLWSWVVVGAPLAAMFFLMAVSAKALSPVFGVLLGLALAASYLVMPRLLIRFYGSQRVRAAFDRDPRTYWTERTPLPILVLCTLYAFYGLALHVPLLFNGTFPLFGTWHTGMPGIILWDAALAGLGLLAWGTFTRQSWAWWSGLAYFGLLTATSVTTLVQSSYADILAVLEFPARELEFLDGAPLEGAHLAVPIALPLLLTLGAIVVARGCFGKTRPSGCSS